jgi:hypothetical protein
MAELKGWDALEKREQNLKLALAQMTEKQKAAEKAEADRKAALATTSAKIVDDHMISVKARFQVGLDAFIDGSGKNDTFSVTFWSLDDYNTALGKLRDSDKLASSFLDTSDVAYRIREAGDKYIGQLRDDGYAVYWPTKPGILHLVERKEWTVTPLPRAVCQQASGCRAAETQ